MSGSGPEWCKLPEDLVKYLEPWDAAPSGEVTDLVQCMRQIHQAFWQVCEGLRQQPALQHILRGTPSSQRWEDALHQWDLEQRRVLEDWSPSTCNVTHTGTHRLPSELLGGLSEHFSRLAHGRNKTPRRWVYHFQSTWRMALKFLEFLQVLALDGFSTMSDLAYWLHRRSYRKGGLKEPEIWSAVAKEPPIFRIAGVNVTAPLRHDVAAPQVVDFAARSREQELYRMVEVGVFQGNLSRHIWQRSASLPGLLGLSH
eukprot:symbB.v1.2.029128.t1/scaffold3156.1/size62204/2